MTMISTTTTHSAYPGKTLRRAPTEEEKQALRELFPERPESACPDCGGYHLRACPRVRRQVWLGQGSGAGTRIEVEYWQSGQYDDSETIYPEEVFDDSPGNEEEE